MLLQQLKPQGEAAPRLQPRIGRHCALPAVVRSPGWAIARPSTARPGRQARLECAAGVRKAQVAAHPQVRKEQKKGRAGSLRAGRIATSQRPVSALISAWAPRAPRAAPTSFNARPLQGTKIGFLGLGIMGSAMVRRGGGTGTAGRPATARLSPRVPPRPPAACAPCGAPALSVLPSVPQLMKCCENRAEFLTASVQRAPLVLQAALWRRWACTPALCGGANWRKRIKSCCRPLQASP